MYTYTAQDIPNNGPKYKLPACVCRDLWCVCVRARVWCVCQPPLQQCIKHFITDFKYSLFTIEALSNIVLDAVNQLHSTTLPTLTNMHSLFARVRGMYTMCTLRQGSLRPIVILNGIQKVLSLVLLKRLRDHADSFIPPSQAGFRKGRGCTAIIFAKRIICSLAQLTNEEAHFLCLDLSKAFNTPSRGLILDSLKQTNGGDPA